MRRIRLGPSAVESTELSFGAAAMGHFTEVDPAQAAAAVHAARDDPRAEGLLSEDRA
ncbi:hypothetical protein [Streptomyces sp. NPDC056452]|uniref:hypothetical protein n=1 Tax=Streptomyces sp. NPDC056452 TaxID=3345821 RepID=UPI00368B4288